MSTNFIRALTDLAIEVLEAQPGVEHLLMAQHQSGLGDPVLDGALAPNGVLVDLYQGPALTRAVDAVRLDPAMAPLTDHDGEPDPMLSSVAGGSRQPLRDRVLATVASALREMYFESEEQTPAVLIQHVVANYETLKQIARGDPIPIKVVNGLAGATIPPDAQITTPWGVVKPAPVPTNPNFYAMHGSRPQTKAVLLRTQRYTVHISRGDEPDVAATELEETFRAEQRTRELLPLAFALAIEGGRRCAPVITFSAPVVPFSSGFGASWGGRPGSPWQQATVEEIDIPAIEEWARRLDTRHVGNLQVAARRIVSAIADRTDSSDALIDAIMAWESLVGTRSESVFRVTAALSKLIEANPAERLAVRKRLATIYDLRSRVVHGDTVDPGKVAEAANEAIDVALTATRALYGRCPEWLTYTSSERADRLILEE